VSSLIVSKGLHEIRIGGVHIVKFRERFFFLGLSVQYMMLLYIKKNYLLNTFVKRQITGDR